MTSLISLTAVLVLAMVVISAGGSKGGQEEVLGQERAGQDVFQRDVRDAKRKAKKKNSGVDRKMKKPFNNRQNKARQNKKGKKYRKNLKKAQKLHRKDKTEPKKKAKTTTKVKSGRAEDKFGHCDYIDLVEVGYRDGSISNCAPGGKFLFKAKPGMRRQFLMTAKTNIAVFLERGKKVTACNNKFRDITTMVKCKPVDGVLDFTTSIELKSSDKMCAKCAKQVTPATTVAPVELGSATKVLCKCPEQRLFTCTTKVEARGNMYTVTCNGNSATTIRCGSPLTGKALAGLFTVDKYDHQLCTSKDYISLLTDYEWRCKDTAVPVPASSSCPGDPSTTAATTAAPGTNAVTTAAPGTNAVTTAAPELTTVAPGTIAVTTVAPGTTAATTAAPGTTAVTTAAPGSTAATTAALGTTAATTAAPGTTVVTTAAPGTTAATTAAPGTTVATTAAVTVGRK